VITGVTEGFFTYQEAYGVSTETNTPDLVQAFEEGYNPFEDPFFQYGEVELGNPLFADYYQWALANDGWLPLPENQRENWFAYWSYVQTGQIGEGGVFSLLAQLATDPNFWVMVGWSGIKHLKGTGSGFNTPPAVRSNALQRSLIDQLYRPDDQYPGGTAGILRAGTPAEISGHMIKARERLVQMRRILDTGMVGKGANRVALDQYDLGIVQILYNDLLHAYQSAVDMGY